MPVLSIKHAADCGILRLFYLFRGRHRELVSSVKNVAELEDRNHGKSI